MLAMKASNLVSPPPTKQEETHTESIVLEQGIIMLTMRELLQLHETVNP
jgi:hypothetical protein